MRVILKQEVHNLGDAGEIVKVAPGYGRNFLLPRGLAIPASEGSVRELEHQKRVAEAIARKQLGAAKELAALKARWGSTLAADPFYNPNLNLDQYSHTGLAIPPRHSRPGP